MGLSDLVKYQVQSAAELPRARYLQIGDICDGKFVMPVSDLFSPVETIQNIEMTRIGCISVKHIYII